MTKRIYCPDIECDSCIKVLSKVLERTEGVKHYSFGKAHLDVEIDESITGIQRILQAIQERGYRASLQPFTRKLFRERWRDFFTNKKKYHIEYLMIQNMGITFLALVTALAGFSWYFLSRSLATKYSWWFLYLVLSIVVLGGAVWHYKSYKTQYTSMVGMMIGMTIGMQTGMMLGSIFGATNGMFTGSLVGMIAGVGVGAYVGSCCGIMGVMEGLMAGVMGGIMGAMTSLMLYVDHLLWFMPVFMFFNILVLMGFSYMLYEEVVEENKNVEKAPPSLTRFFFTCFIAVAVGITIMLLLPPSIFLR